MSIILSYINQVKIPDINPMKMEDLYISLISFFEIQRDTGAETINNKVDKNPKIKPIKIIVNLKYNILLYLKNVKIINQFY